MAETPHVVVRNGIKAEGTAVGSVFTLVNAAVGAGVVSFPYAFSKTGVVLGAALTLTFAVLTVSTVNVLTKATIRTNSTTYSQLAENTLGKPFSLVVSLFLLLNQLGACIAYMMIVGGTVETIASVYGASGSFLTGRRFAIAASSLLVLLPLSLPKTMGAVASVSSLSSFSLIYMCIAIMIRGVPSLFDHREMSKIKLVSLDDLVNVIPVMVFAFMCHVQAPTVAAELSDETSFFKKKSEEESLSTRARIKMMAKINAISSSVVMIGYALIGEFGYISFGPLTESNILKNYPETDILMNLCRVAIAVVSLSSFPININPGKGALDHIICTIMKWPIDPLTTNRHLAQTLFLFFVSLFVALSVKDLGTVFEIIGGSAGALLAFMCPSFMTMSSTYQERTEYIPLLEGETAPEMSRIGTRLKATVFMLIGLFMFGHTLWTHL